MESGSTTINVDGLTSLKTAVVDFIGSAVTDYIVPVMAAGLAVFAIFWGWQKIAKGAKTTSKG